jgi:hypothetical protein
VLPQTGAWTVTVNGSIVSQFGAGILLASGNAAVSTIKIGVDDEVEGGNVGIFLASSGNIINAGHISSVGFAGIGISSGGTHTITNSGEISGPGAIFVSDTSNDTVKNSGTMNGAISLSPGNDTVTNTGTINGEISLGDGSNHLTNSGTITGTLLVGGSGNDTVTNYGTINGEVTLLNGTNHLANAGKIGDDVLAGIGADIVTDFAIVGDVMKSGIITGTIDLGAGNDTYDASNAAGAVFINLDSIAHDLAPIFPGEGFVAANTAAGNDISGTGTAVDTISGFENANGGEVQMKLPRRNFLHSLRGRSCRCPAQNQRRDREWPP